MYHTVAWNRTMVSMLGPHLWNVSGAWQSVPICPKPVKRFFLVCYFLLFTHWDVAYQNIARLCMIWSFYHCQHHVCWNSWCQEIVKDRWSPGNSGEIPRRLCCWSWWAAGSEPIASFSFSLGFFFLRQGLTWHRLALSLLYGQGQPRLIVQPPLCERCDHTKSTSGLLLFLRCFKVGVQVAVEKLLVFSFPLPWLPSFPFSPPPTQNLWTPTEPTFNEFLHQGPDHCLLATFVKLDKMSHTCSLRTWEVEDHFEFQANRSHL